MSYSVEPLETADVVSRDYRERIRFIFTNIRTMNQTEFFNSFKDVRIVAPENMGSGCVLVEATFLHETIGRVRVMMKWFSKLYPIQHEFEIYSDIINSLDVPFFSYPLAAKDPRAVKNNETVQNALVEKVKNILHELHPKKIESVPVGFVMTEHCGYVSFGAYERFSLCRDADFYSGIVQVIVALRFLRKNRILHDDLHEDNIMYPLFEDIYPKSSRLFLNTVTEETTSEVPDEQGGVIELNRIIKIIDWDKRDSGKWDEESDEIYAYRDLRNVRKEWLLALFSRVPNLNLSETEDEEFEKSIYKHCVEQCLKLQKKPLAVADACKN